MKKLLFILLTVLLMLPTAMRAQETLTVADGTETNNYVPVYGLYCDAYLKCEYVFPASDLSDMAGSSISGMTFYISTSAAASWGAANFQVFLAEVPSTSISSYYGPANATVVYTGSLDGTGTTMEVEFDAPYEYGGGNLLVGFYNTVIGTYKSVSFYGVTSSGSCVQGYSYSSLSEVTTNAKGFLPKTTFTYEALGTCRSPKQPTVTDITDNSATMSWSFGDAESSWDIYYTTSTVAPDSLTEPMMTVTDTFAILSNLNDNTIYRAYVRANCGETDGVSNWKAISFRTLCNPANLPYTENFDVYGGTGSGVFPPCWSKVSGTAYINSTAYSEPGALYLSGSSTTPSIAASQAIATEITSTMVSFRAKASSSSYKLIVGVISDPADASTFVPVDTIVPINTNWIQYDIPLTESTLGGSDISVAFKTTGTYYVDDVVVNEAACPRPTAVQVSDIEGNQVKLSWQTYADVDSWMVKYEAGEESFTVPAFENPFVLSGLQSQTEYKVYVASVCGSAQGEFSADAVTFTTTQVLATLPYTCTFDEELEQSEWSFVNGSCTNRWMIGEGANYGDGSNALYISNNNADNEYDINASSIVWAYRDINFDMPGLFYDFAFDWKCEGQNGEAGKIDYFACYVGPISDVAYNRDYVLTPPANAIKLFEGNAQSDWQHFEMTSTTSQATTLRDCGTVRLYFVWANNGSKGTQPAVAIDNISVAPNNCGTPTTITVDNITESSATVNWVAYEPENMVWEVAYATSTSELETAEPIFVEDTTLTLENLTPATTYYLRVRTICGGTDTTEWSSNKTFKTECSIYEAPFAHNFTSSSTPDCWGKKQGLAANIFAGEDFTSETTSNWSFSNGYAEVNIYGSSRKDWLITPMIDLSTVNNPELTFDVWIRSYYNQEPAPDDKFMVVISEDGGATWSQSNATIWSNDGTGDYVYDSITTTHRTYAIPLSDYTASPVKIAFYGESTVSNGDRYLDINNVAIASCAAPTDVAVSDVTESEATISWTGTADSYNLRYKTATDEEWIEELSGVTSPYTLTGLTEATPYMFEVQTVCGAEDLSAWVGGVFTTAGGVVPQTCDLTFKLYDSYGDGWNGSYLDVYVNGEYLGSTTLPSSTSSGTVPLSINNGDVLTLDWDSYSSFDYEASYEIYSGDELLFEGDADNYDEFTYTCNTSSCANTVSNLHTTDITTTSISIAWDDEEASAWVVEYAPVGAAEPVVEPVYTTSYSIENLEVATDYVIKVKADCGDEQSAPTTLTVKTDCELTAIPYAEDFEEYNAVSYSSTGKLPNCWDAYASSTTASYKPKVATSGSYSFAQSGNKSMTFYTSGNASAVLPAMTEALNTLELGFWYKNYSSSTGKLIVGYVTEADSALNTFTAIDTLDNTTTGQQVYYTLDNLTDDAYRIAFKYTTTSTTYTASVDDITLNYIPACAAPSNIATAPASNSITISVEDGADLYEVVYSTTADFDPDLATAVQITNPGDIYNLQPETRYYMYLRTVCGDSHSRWSDIFNDMTASANIAEVPYTCDFEDETENEGWTLLNGTAVNKWFIGEATGNTDHSLYISNDGGTTNAYTNTASTNVWAYRDIQFPTSTGYPYTLSFDWKSKGETSANDYVKVFIGPLSTVSPNTSSTAASAPQGATLVGTFYNQDTWQHVEFDLSDAAYSNTTKRIYILWRNNTSAGVDPSGAIDNIAINYNTCPKPTALRTTYVGGEMVTIAWNQEAADQSNWEVQWRLASDSVWNEPEQVSDANTYTITDLSGTTVYQARVRAICDGETTESNWTEPLNFTTDCVPVVAPWTESFNSTSTLPQCWKIYSGLASDVFNGTSDLTPTTGYWNTNTNAVLTGRHMKINVYGSSIKHWLVTPAIDMSQLSHPILTFDLALTKYNSTDPIADPTAQVDDRFIVAVSTDNGATWNRANATEWNNDGTGAYSFNNIATTGETILVDLAQYEGQEIKIAFYGESTVSGGDNDLHIDNVTVDEAPSCMWPVALRTTATTSSSITLAWDASEDITAWNVEYKLASDTSWEAAQTETVTGMPTVELTGLNSSTAYTIRVQTDCDSETSHWVELTAWTACGEMTIPYTEDFESYASNNEALCWTEMNGLARVSTSYPCSGSKSLKFSGTTDNMVAMPAFDREISELELSFSTRPEGTYSNSGDFQVGYVTDLTNTASFVAVATYSYDDFSGCDDIDITFMDAPEGSYIAFRQFNCLDNYYWFIDNIDVHEIPTCVKPTNLTASNVTTTTVDLAWTENGDAANWNIEYGPAGFTQGQGTLVEATTNPFTLTGLDATTNYDFYVQADCGDGDLSAWSNVVTISTLCEVFDLPFVEDFNSISSGIPTCWDNSEGTTTTESYKWNYYSTGYEGAGLRFNSYFNSNGNTNTLKTPAINIVAGASLSFYYKNPTGGDFSVYVIANGTQTLLEGGLTGMSDWARQSYDLSEYAGQGVQIAFVGTSNYGPTGAYIDLDSVAVLAAAAPVEPCDAPANVQVSNITKNSALVTWEQEPNTASSWIVSYKQSSASSWTIATANTTSYTLSNLNPETSYQVQVTAHCDNDESSEGSEIVSFTTLVDGVNSYDMSSNISIYPNPTNGQFIIRHAQGIIEEVNIYDAYGKLIATTKVDNADVTLDIRNFADGVYFARIVTNDGVITKRIVKR